MILSETKAKGMTISFLKRVENDLSKFSSHLYGHLTHFHSLLIANQNYHTQLPTYYLSYIFSFVYLILTLVLFCLYLLSYHFLDTTF